MNNNKNDLEEFLRYDFVGATGSLCENEKEEIKKEFIRILGMNHRNLSFRLAIQDSDFLYFKENLKALDCIYTTDFDLKLYYLMAKLKLFDGFKDGFCEKLKCEGLDIHLFNASSTPWSLVYLHGSMHLLSKPEKAFDALKLANVQSGNLIENREMWLSQYCWIGHPLVTKKNPCVRILFRWKYIQWKLFLLKNWKLSFLVAQPTAA